MNFLKCDDNSGANRSSAGTNSAGDGPLESVGSHVLQPREFGIRASARREDHEALLEPYNLRKPYKY